MSAIWGCISLDETIIHQDTCNRMKEPFLQYKIDKYTHIQEMNFCMGAGIQYIVKEAEQEVFPVEGEGFYLAADCILDNREELQQKLGIFDCDAVDGQLLKKAYEKWGISFVGHLRGQFAIVIYDKRESCVYLLADQMSTRCLYYYQNDGKLFFSTLIESIKNVNPSINHKDEFIAETLAMTGLRMQIGAENTICRDVYMVPAGHYICVRRQGIEKVSYWNPIDYHIRHQFKTIEEWGSALKKVLEGCVRDAIRTSGNVGVALSSGLDSTTVGGIAAKELGSENLYGYTYVPLEGYKEENQLAIADETAGVKLFCKMHPNIVSTFMKNEQCNAINHMEEMINILEMPYKAVQNTPILCKLFQQAHGDGCRVVLNGHYGNITVSYGNHIDAIYNYLCKGQLGQAFRVFDEYCTLNHAYKKKYALYLVKSYCEAPFESIYRRWFQNSLKNSFVNDDMARTYSLKHEMRKKGYGSASTGYTTIETYRKRLYDLGDLAYLGIVNTKMGLACGVLIRDPFQDIRIMEFCADVPMKAFVYKGMERWLVRGNMDEYIPKVILHNYRFRGKQSADWMYRLQLDVDNVIAKMREACFSDDVEKYVDQEKLKDYFECLGGNFRQDMFTRTNQVLYVMALSTYLKHK